MSATLYTAATVHTLAGPAAAPPVRGILVQDERVLATGDPAELAAHAPAGTRTVDLGDAVVVPGLTDAHVHLTHLADELAGVDLRSATSEEECLRRVAGHVGTLPPGTWVFGGFWNINAWDTPEPPHRRGLDAVTGDHPVALVSSDAHTIWANSAALTALGITRDTPDPDGGEIVRDADGEATGVLRESAVFPVRALQDGPAGGDPDDRFARVQRHLLAQGLTGVHDVDGMTVLSSAQRLRERGELDLRLVKLLPVAALDEHIAAGRRTGDGDPWIRIGPVKIFADGALGSHTCLMSHPFPAGDPRVVVEPSAAHGVEVTGPAALDALLDRLIDNGLAAAVHAIGDRANTQVLDALARAAHASRTAGLRHRIEHAQFVRREDLPRLAQLGIIASMQPQHYAPDLALRTLVPDPAIAAYAWRSVLDAGATLAFGSDAPVEPPRPLHGLAAAIARWDPDGAPGTWQPEERLTARQALAAYTTGAAAASGENTTKGTLAPGMVADLTVLDVDPLTAHPEAIRDATVLATVVGGRVRYEA
ncbi:amidohydrolase [Tersicoccus sp. MR15.9]|uniref:amidohydrolase n=1 Tax=Tersicoccus mangrovi TaxID=3121635 RepID=UPI002FE6C161